MEWIESTQAQRMAVTVMPTASDATVRYRKPLMVGASCGVDANQTLTAGENRLMPHSAVAPGTR